MTTHDHPELSPLAQAILDDKWIMTTPEWAIGYAIDEFVYMTVSPDHKYTYDDKEVTCHDFTDALSEIVRYVTATQLWGKGAVSQEASTFLRFRLFTRDYTRRLARKMRRR